MKNSSRFTQDHVSTSIHDILRETCQWISDFRDRKERVTGIESGLYELDDITTGFHPSNLVVIAGRPSMGKTSFALTIVRHVALELRKPVLYFSLDMGAQSIARSLLCAHAGIDSQKLRKKNISDDEYSELMAKAGAFQNAPLFIDDTCGPSIFELRARARRYKARHKIEMIVVDYLQLLEAHDDGWGSTEDRGTEISIISRTLKALARELEAPVVVLSQVSRRTESRANHRPVLSDLRGAGGIDQVADLVLMLYRDEYYNPDTCDRNIAEITIARQRNSPTGFVKLRFIKEHMCFMNPTGPAVEAPDQDDDAAPGK